MGCYVCKNISAFYRNFSKLSVIRILNGILCLYGVPVKFDVQNRTARVLKATR